MQKNEPHKTVCVRFILILRVTDGLHITHNNACFSYNNLAKYIKFVSLDAYTGTLHFYYSTALKLKPW